MSEHLGRPTLSIKDACQAVGVTRRTIYNWLADGKLEMVRTATGHVRIYTDSLWRVAPPARDDGTDG